MVRSLAIPNVNPFKSNAALLATTTWLVLFCTPSGELGLVPAIPSFTTPALIFILDVVEKVLLPANTNVPVPDLPTEKLPVITPQVNAAVPATLSVIPFVSVRAPTVNGLVPPNLNPEPVVMGLLIVIGEPLVLSIVGELAIVNAVAVALVPKAAALFMFNVPAFNVTIPV